MLVASYEIKETEGIIGDCVTEYLPFFHHLFNNIGFTAPYVLHAINAIHVDEIFFKCSDCSCDDCKSRTKKKSWEFKNQITQSVLKTFKNKIDVFSAFFRSFWLFHIIYLFGKWYCPSNTMYPLWTIDSISQCYCHPQIEKLVRI